MPQLISLPQFLDLVSSIPGHSLTPDQLRLEIDLQQPGMSRPCCFQIDLQSEAAHELLDTLRQLAQPEAAGSPDEQGWLAQFDSYIATHLSDSQLSVAKIAHHFSMSESTLRRQVSQLTGLSPLRYLQEQRLKRAAVLLEGGCFGSITQVAKAVGYVTLSAFSRKFKQQFGYNPSVGEQVA